MRRDSREASLRCASHAPQRLFTVVDKETIEADTISGTTIAESETAVMRSSSEIANEHSLARQPAQLEDMRFADAVRALVKAGFLISNRPQAPHHAYQLDLAEADVLATVARAQGGHLNCSEIAEKTLITKGGITKILDRLETRGLVTRVPSRDDRRSISVQLSAKGVELWRRFYPEIARSAREVLEKAFRPEQTRQFSKLLDLLVRSLEADSAKASISASEPTHTDKRI
jgi:DNA-binding MarR family transcriptional regulator